MPDIKHNDLMQMYKTSEQIDSTIFSEMRSNIRLVAGDHYLKGLHQELERSRAGKTLSNEAKLRLTQNHISRFSNTWVNSIINAAPDVQIVPNNQNELKDKKAAQMNQSVKNWIEKTQKVSDKKRKLVRDFIDIGECAVKIWYDPDSGPIVNGDLVQEINELTGEVELVQQQVRLGEVKISRVLGFNLLRDSSAKDWDECAYLTERRMIDKKELLSYFPGEENSEKRRMIQESSDETYNVYNGATSSREESKKVLLLETYYKPSKIYPNGYYYIYTTFGILSEGELPGGIFPIIVCNFDDIPTTPRGRSKIKQLRPIQAEINRVVSKMAEHQITIGDDKIFIHAGTKMQESNKLSGVRAIQIQGMAPTILPGRSGEQYVNYWQAMIGQFDRIAEIMEVDEDKVQTMEPSALMYRAMKHKKRFSLYAEKFEDFLIEMWDTILKVYKFHVPPYGTLPSIGSHDQINLDEFKSSDDLSFQISVKARTDDPESMMGKQMSLIQALQYAGDKLTDTDVGQIIANLPFLDKNDFSSSASDLYERATAMILKLDKGVDMPISSQDDAVYMIKRLDKRMSESDFDQITANVNGNIVPNEYIQQLYFNKKAQYEELIAQRMMEEKARLSTQIPTTGELIPVQMYSSVPNSDGTGFKVQRENFPYDALKWLKDTLISQGMTEETIQGFSPSVQSDINSLMVPQEPTQF